MKRALWLVSVIWLLSIPLLPATAQRDEALILRLDGALTQAMSLYLDRVLTMAQAADAEVVILELDTPGGEVSLMQTIVQSLRASPVPVVVFITPRGANAGSAGTVIALAGHAAAMSPETAIGAASPVSGEGADLGETLDRKLKEILKADVRSLAERRGSEAVALAEATVEEARAATATEAFAVGLVDFIAEDPRDLLRQLDGFTVEVQSTARTLQTGGLLTTRVEMTLIEQLLNVLVNPLVVFALLTVGVQAILIELSSPGGWVAGTIGVLSIALALYGLGVLNVNWFGLVLVGLAFALFILEVKTPTFGALALAGLASLIAAGLVLFNTSGAVQFQRISIPGLIAVALISSAFFVFILGKALAAQKRPATTGLEALIGRVAEVRTPLEPKGTVLLDGEIWRAEAEGTGEALDPGTTVEVVATQGLRLKVRPLK